MSKANILIVDDVQHAAILAALRFYQQCGGSSIGADIENIASNGDAFTPLVGDQIDTLCESINQASPAKAVVIDALKANGFCFSDFVAPFGDTEESSPFVKAAREAVARKEGSLEVDEPTIVSDGDKNGSYVMGWIWVSNEEAGILPNSEVLERLHDSLDVTDNESFNAYLAWLEETLTNFADEIDEIESEEVGAGEPDQIQWEHEGEVYTFHPSDALKELLAATERMESLDADDAARVKAFIEQYGSKLDRVLRARTLFANQL